jgi:SNF family Na+-dependent transporter
LSPWSRVPSAQVDRSQYNVATSTSWPGRRRSAAGSPRCSAGTWFDTFDYLASSWLAPLGGLGIALVTAWRVDQAIRHRAFHEGTNLVVFDQGWLLLLKFVVPVGIVLVFLHAIGAI